MYHYQRCLLVLLLINIVLITRTQGAAYDVHWLEGPSTIERDVPTPTQGVDIYCYTGTSKSLFTLWQTVKFHIKIKNDEFCHYVGPSPEEVYKEYTKDSSGWSFVNSFQRKAQKTISVNLFNPTCLAVNTKLHHTIDLQVLRVDIGRVLLMMGGVTLIFSSRALSSSPVFFYLYRIFVRVLASFMLLVYYVSKLLPRKTLIYSILIGGLGLAGVGVFLFQQLCENLRTLVLTYQNSMFWYTLLVSFISFVVCYRIGIVMWTLQVVGILMIFLSSEHQEASAIVIIFSLVAKYFLQSLINGIRTYCKFPPKPKLLSSEEYYEQSARETKQALENLRKYCSNPDRALWKIMLKLNDSKRFANFVEGNSHLSNDEVLDYQLYVLSLEANRKPNPQSTRNMEICDDVDHDTGSDEDWVYFVKRL